MMRLQTLRQSPHALPLLVLGSIVLLLNAVVVGVGYYITQVSFPGAVIELQFTAYQGTTVIETSSTIWWQVGYALGITLINSLFLAGLWWRRVAQRLVRFVCMYWLAGMTIVTLGGILYYLVLVIQVNSLD